MPKSIPDSSDPALRLIVRISTPSLKGWDLQIPAWHPQGPAAHFFGDDEHGSEKKSLKAAQSKRKALFKKIDISLDPAETHAQGDLSARNSSGLIGVGLWHDKNRKHWAWQAFWSFGAKQDKARFSVEGHGFEQAFWAAVDARQKNTGVLFTNEELREALRRGREEMERVPASDIADTDAATPMA